MRDRSNLELVKLHCFVQATRDSGYKSAGYALAELVDNALEAGADKIDIDFCGRRLGRTERVDSIAVTDDGCGMSPETLQLALQFGGTTRFNSRSGRGRFGMGLPNSSLSQAKKVDVITWQHRSCAWQSSLDVDDVIRGTAKGVPKPTAVSYSAKSKSGTIVKLSNCDRFQYHSIGEACSRLQVELGRLFRDPLFNGITLRLNGHRVAPCDPLFLRGKDIRARANPYGPPLKYSIRVEAKSIVSEITVTFALLPLGRWHNLSNEEKNRIGVSKGAGVSIMRAGREIDHGWYFMGSKRKENYDDWWRCEVRFDPDLDEMFGVTHTKQGIRPSESLEELLTPDLERIARNLNSIVRKHYAQIKAQGKSARALMNVSKKDHLLEPPSNTQLSNSRNRKSERIRLRSGLGGLKYKVRTTQTVDQEFYQFARSGNEVVIILNELHPFYSQVYKPIMDSHCEGRQTHVIEHVRALLAAAARAEICAGPPSDREIIHRFRRTWSNALMAFLS
jgi:hypothetical protein